MVVLASSELALAREAWRSRLRDLPQDDQVKVAGLLALSLPLDGMEKQAIWRWLGRGIGSIGRFFFPPVRSAAAPAAAAAGAGAARAAAPEAAAAAAAGAGAQAAGEAAQQLPGYLGRMYKSWQDLGTPGPWMTKHLGRLAQPAATAMKWGLPVGSGYTMYHGMQGNIGPVSTAAGSVVPFLTLPVMSTPLLLAELGLSMYGAPKVDEWLGWKPRAQREAEMYASGAQRGVREMMANVPSPAVAPVQQQMPAPGTFYQPTMAYSPLAAMQTERAGRMLRGEY